MEFAYNNNYQTTIQMAPFEALYERRCQTPVFWKEDETQQLTGLELIQATNAAIQKIRSKILPTKSQQKSYSDTQKNNLKFTVGEHVFLKVAPMRGMLRFGKKGKLSLRFIGPFEILERIGAVGVQVALPPTLAAMHNFFHVSMLRKYISDPTHIIKHKVLLLREDLSYEKA